MARQTREGRRISAGANKLGAVSAHRAATVTKYGRADSATAAQTRNF